MKLSTKLLAMFGLVVAFTLGLSLAAWAEDAKVPEWKLAIHYYRADGKYDGWGVHVWSRGEEKRHRPDIAGSRLDEFSAARRHG